MKSLLFVACAFVFAGCSLDKGNVDDGADGGRDTVAADAGRDSAVRDICADAATDVADGELTAGGGPYNQSSRLLDCSLMVEQDSAFLPDPGKNCIERHLFYWAKSARTLFQAAAFVTIGPSTRLNVFDYTDSYGTDYNEYYFTTFPDSMVDDVVFGSIPDAAIAGCHEYSKTDDDSDFSRCVTPIFEWWYVIPGRSLAFFGYDCVLESWNPGVVPIMRLYPVRDGNIIDYDGSLLSVDEAVNLMSAGTAEWPDGHPTTGWSACPEGVRIIK